MALGELKKMKLVAYTDASFSSAVPGVEYEVLINPEIVLSYLWHRYQRYHRARVERKHPHI